jgi:hypothetical protein
MSKNGERNRIIKKKLVGDIFKKIIPGISLATITHKYHVESRKCWNKLSKEQTL